MERSKRQKRAQPKNDNAVGHGASQQNNNAETKLAPAGFSMMKIWHTMKDERVRPNKARKTQKGWKYSKGGKYNHVAMEGVAVPINEKFKLPSGAMTDGPGQGGVAGEDINCRCFLSYEIKKQTTIQTKLQRLMKKQKYQMVKRSDCKSR